MLKTRAVDELVSPVTEASADCSQLPSGMMCDSSRMKRSQSKRVAATCETDRVRVAAICAKPFGELTRLSHFLGKTTPFVASTSG